jgi:hypothetical protein
MNPVTSVHAITFHYEVWSSFGEICNYFFHKKYIKLLEIIFLLSRILK